MLSQIKRLNYRHVLPDIVIIAAASYLSLFLRLGWEEDKAFLSVLNKGLLLFLFFRIGTFIAMGVYDIIWRYISMKDAITIVKAVMVSSTIIIAASYVVDIGRLPRTTFFIEAALLTIMLLGIRFTRRLVYEYASGQAVKRHGRRTLICGAGTNGRALVNRLSTDSHSGFKLMGFADDDPQKVGRFIGGIKVLGTRKDLPRLIKEYALEEIIVAIGKAPEGALRETVQLCRASGITPRLVTSMSGLTDQARSIRTLRTVELSDLLNRPKRHIDVTAIRGLVEGRKVLITGAGGSIGSELARQISALSPSSLCLLDHSEFNLYQIDRELRASPSDNNLVVPCLGDIKNRGYLRGLFEDRRPEIVFHAAAYKHVHLVEHNPCSSIQNNIEGTKNLVELSEEFGVDTFVLISTDKAVNPAGVMGSTKRVCELMVAAAGKRTGRRYCAVRFGNVLGSSGSLIPLLTSQIQSGGAVTITHKDMTRYFMLISEAVSLVLKAATIANAGDIALLNMGEPVRIVDIATSLIALMGKSESEVPIVYTGLRPGEKLFEELYICGNELKTEDPDILVLPRGDNGAHGGEFDLLRESVERVLSLAEQGDRQAVLTMNALVKSNFASSVAAAVDFVPPREKSEPELLSSLSARLRITPASAHLETRH